MPTVTVLDIILFKFRKYVHSGIHYRIRFNVRVFQRVPVCSRGGQKVKGMGKGAEPNVHCTGEWTGQFFSVLKMCSFTTKI